MSDGGVFPCPYCPEKFDTGHEKADHLTDVHDAYTLAFEGDLAPLVRQRAEQSAQ